MDLLCSMCLPLLSPSLTRSTETCCHFDLAFNVGKFFSLTSLLMSFFSSAGVAWLLPRQMTLMVKPVLALGLIYMDRHLGFGLLYSP